MRTKRDMAGASLGSLREIHEGDETETQMLDDIGEYIQFESELDLVRRTIAGLQPELEPLMSSLRCVCQDTYEADVTHFLPPFLCGAFKRLYLKAITGPGTIRISWEWRHPDNSFNGKDLCFMTIS